jgi:hypothetical protein
LFSDEGRGYPEVVRRIFYTDPKKVWGGTMKELPSFDTPCLWFVAGPPGSGKSSLQAWIKTYLNKSTSARIKENFQKAVGMLENEGIVPTGSDKKILGDDGVVTIDVDKFFLGKIRLALKESEKSKDLSQKIYNMPRYIADQLSDLVFFRAVASGAHIIFEVPLLINEGYFYDLKRISERNGYKVAVLHMNTDAEECIRRAKERQEKTGQEAAPDEDIRKIADQSKSLADNFDADVKLYFVSKSANESLSEATKLALNLETVECATKHEQKPFAIAIREPSTRSPMQPTNLDGHFHQMGWSPTTGRGDIPSSHEDGLRRRMGQSKRM